MTERRHLLVVATQCPAMGRLERLEEAARELRDVLRDPWLGGCEPGLPDGTDLLDGTDLPDGDFTSDVIDERVWEAIRHAGRRRAVLVLALLGHGFVPGNAPSLYLMGADSQDQVRKGASDVQRLIGGAVDQPGVSGVVAVVDTCMAAGAVPPMGEVLDGVRGGQTRLAMLLAAAVGEDAYDLRSSRSVAAVLRSGVVDAGRMLDVNAVLPHVQAAVPGQSVAGFGYAGDMLAGGGLWLACNRRHVEADGAHCVGQLGWARLREALDGLERGDLASVPDQVSPAFLKRLHQHLQELPPTLGRDRAVRIVHVLQATTATVTFLRHRLPRSLTRQVLRRGLATVDRAIQRRLRLVVSLHGSVTGHDWPEQLDAWLLCDGRAAEHDVVDCHPTQAGVEDALRKAVQWGEDHAADLELKLRRVEVAAPARLLLHWHPELVRYGPRLGVDYEVIVRSSARLNPPERWMVRRAEECLATVADATSPVVHWLGEHETREAAKLRQRLEDGRYPGPIGLHRHRGDAVKSTTARPAASALTSRRGAPAARWVELPAAGGRMSTAGGEDSSLGQFRSSRCAEPGPLWKASPPASGPSATSSAASSRWPSSARSGINTSVAARSKRAPIRSHRSTASPSTSRSL